MLKTIAISDATLRKMAELIYDLTKSSEVILDLVKKIDNQTKKTQIEAEVFGEAINMRLINKDLNVTNSLKELAYWLLKNKPEVKLSPHFLKQFKRRDGKEYKFTSLQEAVKFAKRKREKNKEGNTCPYCGHLLVKASEAKRKSLISVKKPI